MDDTGPVELLPSVKWMVQRHQGHHKRAGAVTNVAIEQFMTTHGEEATVHLFEEIQAVGKRENIQALSRARCPRPDLSRGTWPAVKVSKSNSARRITRRHVHPRAQ